MPDLTSRSHPRNILLAARGLRAGRGAKFALMLVVKARKAKVPVEAAFALVEKESAFRNVYGHDPVRNPAPKGGKVTKRNYTEVYLPARKRGLGMQGVGLTQLTWYEFQDRADRLGGCWKPENQITVGLDIIGGYYRAHRASGDSKREALRKAGERYNGTGPAAVRYGVDFLDKCRKWHKVLFPRADRRY